MNNKASVAAVHYFGLPVEVVSRLDSCALIRFRRREFIVDTADLVFSWGLKQAA